MEHFIGKIKLNFVIFGLTILFSTTVFSKSSVWKVSKNNNHIYIGGTIHILPKSEFPLPDEFREAYKNSDSIVLETMLPSPTNTNFQIKLMQKVSYKNHQRLSKIISPETFKALEKYLADFNVNLTDLDGFKPGFIVSMMAVMEAKRAGISGEGVDAYYNHLAAKDNKALEFLESMDFQLNLLADMGLDDEEALIQSTLSQMEEFKEIFLKIIPAWRNGNEQKLNTLIIQSMKDENPALFKTMITNRNNNWISLIEKMFTDQDREFVLVGIGHLVGEGNVLSLLKNKGYQITKL
jgi:uncharacterized protein YbaP (TraB family)